MIQAEHTTPHYIESLNPSQKEAVENLDGAVLVLAGAGTGKTRVLTTRLAHLLQTNKALPAQILAVTFTNKAASEMKERISSLLNGTPVDGWYLGTFHSLCARMLRQHANLVGLDQNFTILDTDDQIRLIKQILENLNVDHKKWTPRSILSIIDRWKDKARTPDKITSEDTGDYAGGKLITIYRQYQQRLKEINACDFSDLILHTITILKDPKNKHILESYHNRFRYIMVDEYQDTNTAQYMWLRLLAQGTGNICCVGDDDQSIYGWRGAEVGNILRFEQDFKDAKIIRLEQNYRSTEHILKAAGGVIANNQGRLGKELWSEQGAGEKITIKGLWDGEAEARWVGEEIQTLQSKGKQLKEIAILVRAGFQTRDFEERFIALGLPYRVIGGPRFYERAEIRDALAYLRVIAQPSDDLALERIINVPKRGIGGATVKSLYEFARTQNTSLYEATKMLIDTDELKPKVRNTLTDLITKFEQWRDNYAHLDHVEATSEVLEQSGYLDMWRNDKSPDAAGRVENLNELGSAMSEFESLEEFLEHIALVMENQNKSADNNQITIMTLHGAKGLEFDTVFLPGWEDGLFPSQKSMDENGMKGLEEERRLAYVGITRAKKKAYIAYAANRRMYGNWVNNIPSRFINELPEENIETESETGLYNQNQGRSSHWDSSGYSANYKKKSVSQKSTQYQNKIADKSDHPFKPGTKVEHPKFGKGTVIHLDGHKLDIKFEKAGQKRVLDSFVERLEG